MPPSIVRELLATVALCGVLAGCTPDPPSKPGPTPSGAVPASSGSGSGGPAAPTLVCMRYNLGCTATDGLTDAMVAELRATGNLRETKLELRGHVTDADVLRLLQLKDVLVSLELETKELSDVTALGDLAQLQALVLSGLQGKLARLDALKRLTGLKKLEIRYIHYPDLSFVEPLAALEEARFLDQAESVHDLSPLADKTHLRKLSLDGRGITDISALNRLTELEELTLLLTRVSDLSLLAKFRHLKRLQLWNLPATDLAPVAGLLDLEQLVINSTRFRDHTPLAKLTHLRELRAGESALDSLAHLRNAHGLTHLEVDKTPIQDWAVLSDMTALEHLDVADTSFRDLRSLSGMRKLRILDISGCDVIEPVALAKLPELGSLYMTGTKGIPSLAIVGDLPKVNYVTVRKGQFPEAEIERLQRARPGLQVKVY